MLIPVAIEDMADEPTDFTDSWYSALSNADLTKYVEISAYTDATSFPGLFPPNFNGKSPGNEVAQASFSRPRVDLARLLRRAYSRSVWIISFEFVKVCGIRFSIWESFIGFYICCYPISTILARLFSVGVRISWKKLC